MISGWRPSWVVCRLIEASKDELKAGQPQPESNLKEELPTEKEIQPVVSEADLEVVTRNTPVNTQTTYSYRGCPHPAHLYMPFSKCLS
jgi:hypothetical protein